MSNFTGLQEKSIAVKFDQRKNLRWDKNNKDFNFKEVTLITIIPYGGTVKDALTFGSVRSSRPKDDETLVDLSAGTNNENTRVDIYPLKNGSKMSQYFLSHGADGFPPIYNPDSSVYDIERSKSKRRNMFEKQVETVASYKIDLSRGFEGHEKLTTPKDLVKSLAIVFDRGDDLWKATAKELDPDRSLRNSRDIGSIDPMAMRVLEEHEDGSNTIEFVGFNDMMEEKNRQEDAVHAEYHNVDYRFVPTKDIENSLKMAHEDIYDYSPKEIQEVFDDLKIMQTFEKITTKDPDAQRSFEQLNWNFEKNKKRYLNAFEEEKKNGETDAYRKVPQAGLFMENRGHQNKFLMKMIRPETGMMHILNERRKNPEVHKEFLDVTKNLSQKGQDLIQHPLNVVFKKTMFSGISEQQISPTRLVQDIEKAENREKLPLMNIENEVVGKGQYLQSKLQNLYRTKPKVMNALHEETQSIAQALEKAYKITQQEKFSLAAERFKNGVESMEMARDAVLQRSPQQAQNSGASR